ncbi:hypothetical protein ACIBG0_40485, partial [Nocardia sp. NPDC050630]
MTTLDAVARKEEPVQASAEELAAQELVRMAKEQGLSLTGPNGLLKQFTMGFAPKILDAGAFDAAISLGRGRSRWSMRLGYRPRSWSGCGYSGSTGLELPGFRAHCQRTSGHPGGWIRRVRLGGQQISGLMDISSP